MLSTQKADANIHSNSLIDKLYINFQEDNTF